MLVNHIWMLLLLQRIFWEVPVLVLLYLIVHHLYGCFCCFRRLVLYVQDPAYNLTFKLLLIVVFLWMVHNKKLFRRSSVKYQTFSEGPTWSDLFSLRSKKKWKAAVNSPRIVVYTVKSVTFLVRINSEYP